jgi:hypothetical protein
MYFKQNNDNTYTVMNFRAADLQDIVRMVRVAEEAKKEEAEAAIAAATSVQKSN